MFIDSLVDFSRERISHLGYGVLAMAIVILFVGILWHVMNALTKFDDNAELIGGNWAYLAQRLSLCGAQIIGMLPGLERFNTDTPWTAAAWLAAEGLWVAVALLLTRYVVDYVVLPGIDNINAMRKDKDTEPNTAVGITEAGFYLGIGFLINGSLTGTATSLELALASTAVFYLLGLGLTIGVFWFHEWFTSYHLRDGLRAGKLTSGIEVAGIILATSIVVREGVAGDFTGWKVGFAAFLSTALIAVALMYVFRAAIDLVVLRTTTVKSIQANDQVVASALLAGLLVASAFPVATVVRYLL